VTDKQQPVAPPCVQCGKTEYMRLEDETDERVTWHCTDDFTKTTKTKTWGHVRPLIAPALALASVALTAFFKGGRR